MYTLPTISTPAALSDEWFVSDDETYGYLAARMYNSEPIATALVEPADDAGYAITIRDFTTGKVAQTASHRVFTDALVMAQNMLAIYVWN